MIGSGRSIPSLCTKYEYAAGRGFQNDFGDERGLECEDICVQLLIRSKWMACICTRSDTMTRSLWIVILCRLMNEKLLCVNCSIIAALPRALLDAPLIPNISNELARAKLSLWILLGRLNSAVQENTLVFSDQLLRHQCLVVNTFSAIRRLSTAWSVLS